MVVSVEAGDAFSRWGWWRCGGVRVAAWKRRVKPLSGGMMEIEARPVASNENERLIDGCEMSCWWLLVCVCRWKCAGGGVDVLSYGQDYLICS